MSLGAEPEQLGAAPNLPEPAVLVKIGQMLGLFRKRVDQEGKPHPPPVREIQTSVSLLAHRHLRLGAHRAHRPCCLGAVSLFNTSGLRGASPIRISLPRSG